MYSPPARHRPVKPYARKDEIALWFVIIGGPLFVIGMCAWGAALNHG